MPELKDPIYTDPKVSSNTISRPSLEQRRSAVYTGPLNPIIRGTYSVALYDTRRNAVVTAPGLDPARRAEFAEYFFTTPPRQHEFTEPYSTTIVPTQRGGKFIESHGSILKNIKVSGTTGIRPNPNRRAIANIPLIGSAVDTAASNIEVLSGQGLLLQDRHLDKSEATGYDDIIFLRNIFRYYSDLKESGRDAGRIVMLWRNYKDADYWVVEPIDFRLVQSSKSPLTYEYNIQFRTLTKFDTNISIPIDPLARIKHAQKFFSRVQEYTKTAKRMFLLLQTQQRRIDALGVFAATQLIEPAVDIAKGLSGVKSTGSEMGQAVFDTVNTLKFELRDAIDKIKDSDKLDRQDPILNTLNRYHRLCTRIQTEPAFRESVSAATRPRQLRATRAYTSGGDAFNRSRVAPSTGGASSFIGNESITDSVNQDTVRAGEDIRSLAGRLLGDRSRWHALVLLNSLKSPYISSSGDADTLKPGDPVLFPSTIGTSSGTIDNLNPDNAGTENQDENVFGPVQQVYGRDLRLRSVDVDGVDMTDLSIGQNGDVSTVAGIPNVDQALRIKFSTERGELPSHPNFGAQFPIGSKATNFAFNEFQIQTEATLLSDQRIQDINSLQFDMIGDTIVMSTAVVLNPTADTLNTSLALRRV